MLVRRDGEDLAVVSVEFVMSNYRQNAINYFEGQLGETANLRRQNLVYGNLFFVTNPIPYNRRDLARARVERILDRDIHRYNRLRLDHRHAHAPDEMAVVYCPRFFGHCGGGNHATVASGLISRRTWAGKRYRCRWASHCWL